MPCKWQWIWFGKWFKCDFRKIWQDNRNRPDCGIHINDSKNELGAGKDRHENIGKGCIGFETLHKIVHLPEFERVPKILETPYIKDENDSKNSYPPYKEEIAMLRKWFHIFIINKIDNMMIGKSKATIHLTITAIHHKCLNDY